MSHLSRRALLVTVAAASLATLRRSAAQDKPAAKTKGFQPYLAHEFDQVDEWLNSKPLLFKELRGQVVIMHFWTYGCINCLHNLPHYAKWQKDFAQEKVTLIGVHTPETGDEKLAENVRKNVKKLGITYPVAVDSTAHIWKTWKANMWPTVGLIDKAGYLRYYWEGELNWKEQKGEEFMRGKITELLKEQVKS